MGKESYNQDFFPQLCAENPRDLYTKLQWNTLIEFNHYIQP